MRAKARDSWEVGGKVRRRAPWTAVAASSLALAIEDPVGQMGLGQTAAGGAEAAEAAEIASVTAAFPLEEDQRAEGLLAAAPEE
jgi:hypothetical protein